MTVVDISILAAFVYSLMDASVAGYTLSLVGTVVFPWSIPTIYFTARYYFRKSRGVPIEVRFKEIPPY